MQLENIQNLKEEINSRLEGFLDEKQREGRKNGMPPEFFEALENIQSFVLRGGKRLRPILFYYGYILSGGDKKENALDASIALEFLHAGFLIHDDVMDRDSIRHNGLSMHAKYEKDYALKLQSKFKNNFDLLKTGHSCEDKRPSLTHFGSAIAICLGDAVLSWSYEILAKADFGEDKKNKIIAGISDIITETSIGQMLDEMLQIGNDFSEELIYKVHDYKTARYTVRGPLWLGAIVAGAEQEELEFISRFSIPLGIAYQIRDDIIGVFGDQKEIGKPVGSDIREGKKTLLVSYALKNSGDKEREFLLGKLGDREIMDEDIEKLRKIIVSSGALAYSEGKIDEFAEEFLRNLDSDPEGYSKKYSSLKNFAQYFLQRKF